MLPSNHLRQPHQRHNDEAADEDDDDEDDDEDDEDQRIDGSTMRYPVGGGRVHRNPTAQHMHVQQQPPLGITGVLCDSNRLVIPGRGTLHYTIFRPRSCVQNQSHQQHVPSYRYKPPVVCVPGGPLIPSNYLQSIVYTVTDRSVILYDPIGCGQSTTVQSDASDANAVTTVADQTSDLKYLLDHLPCRQFHLMGHSFGGILVYEYLKLVVAEDSAKEEQVPAQADSSLDTPLTTKITSTDTGSASASASMSPKGKECCSVILSSTPVSIATCQADCDRLLKDIRKELALERNKNSDDDDNDDAEDFMRQQLGEDQHHHPISKQAQDIFWQRHECRVAPMPYALEQALQQSSVQSTAGHGLLQQRQDSNSNADGTGTGLRDYVATVPSLVTRNAAKDDVDDGDTSAGTSGASNIASITMPIMPPALVLRGQYDFVLESNSLDVWSDLLLSGDGQGIDNTECMTLAGTSHYAMVEQENLFGSVVQVFLQKHDPDPAAGQLEQVNVKLQPPLVQPPAPRHHKHKKNRLLRNHHNDSSARHDDR
jgi:pimeloyl-ACP methyl ester carboxylesterase